MLSDDDLVTMTHVVKTYDALPNAELAVVTGTSHFLTQEKPALVNAIVLDFLTNDRSRRLPPSDARRPVRVAEAAFPRPD